MHVTLDMTDAMELEQLLDFLARWMKAEHDCLAPSLVSAALQASPGRHLPPWTGAASLVPTLPAPSGSSTERTR
jgi:hypothetical protein